LEGTFRAEVTKEPKLLANLALLEVTSTAAGHKWQTKWWKCQTGTV